MVDLATKSLLHDKLRFLITVSGVAFAVTLVFVQVGLFLGLLDNASVTIEHIDADLWVTSRNTPNVDFAHTFPDTAVKRVRSVPGVARADNLIVWFVTVNLPTGAQEGSLVYALEDFSGWNIPWNVAEGELSDLRRGQYFFLDESAVKRYGAFEVGQYREILGQRMKIIGRTREARSFTTTPILFVDFDRAQTLNPQSLRGKTTYVLVKLAPGADAAAVKAEIARRLPYNDVYTKKEWAARSRNYWVQSTGIGLNMYLTVFLGCLVGVVVVAQTLYTSTMEHLKEFGTVKAIGGGNSRHLPDPRKAGLDRGRGRVRARSAHGLCPAAGHREDRPEADHPADLRRDRVRRIASHVPRRGDDLVPEGRIDRPGARVPGLAETR